MTTPHEAQEPTQDQLQQLCDTVLSYEVDIPPLAGIPPDVDLTRFVHLATLPMFNERIAPAATLKAPDKRVIWLSIFRNPDNRSIAKTSILILDPPVNRDQREELPVEDYTIATNALGKLAIERADGPTVTAPEVTVLQNLIAASELFNPFPE